VNLQVKYGLIRLISTTADLCEQIKNVDLECPIEKGKLSITKSVDLPKEIPPVRLVSPPFFLDALLKTRDSQGRYTVVADVYTKDHKKITCITAQVQFGGRKASLDSILDL
jgi:hypothetical protein